MDSREMYLVMGYGETPMPEVELVFTLDEAFNAVARMVYGDPSPSELLEARADFCDFEERVRDGFEWHAEFEIGGIHAWKVCVPDDLVGAVTAQAAAAALVVSQFDMLAHLQRQRVFSERTFGPGKRTRMVADHIRKELIEIEAKPSDLTEWVDVILLALDGAWRSGATATQIVETIQAKQTKNEGRVWPDWRTADPDKAIEHDRSRDADFASTSVVSEPVISEELHPDTAKLVRRFARALGNKLLAAQRKHGYSDNWMRDNWGDECRAELMRHIQKGDPRDVAAYCAFLWHHNESTATQPAQTERAMMDEVISIAAKYIQTGYLHDFTAEVRALTAAQPASGREA